MKQVAFSIDKRGKELAYLVSLQQMRNIRISVEKARLMLATGTAKQVPYRPFGPERNSAPARRNATKTQQVSFMSESSAYAFWDKLRDLGVNATVSDRIYGPTGNFERIIVYSNDPNFSKAAKKLGKTLMRNCGKGIGMAVRNTGWIPAKAVKIIGNQVHVLRNPAERNIQEGFYDEQGFHPIRASADYSPSDVGEAKKRKPRKVAKARKRAPAKRKVAAKKKARRR